MAVGDTAEKDVGLYVEADVVVRLVEETDPLFLGLRQGCAEARPEPKQLLLHGGVDKAEAVAARNQIEGQAAQFGLLVVVQSIEAHVLGPPRDFLQNRQAVLVNEAVLLEEGVTGGKIGKQLDHDLRRLQAIGQEAVVEVHLLQQAEHEIAARQRVGLELGTDRLTKKDILGNRRVGVELVALVLAH